MPDPTNDEADRDGDVLEHVARYRITTNEVLSHLFFRTDNATKKVMRRLAAPIPPKGTPLAEEQKTARPFFLQTRELLGKRQYYHLAARGAHKLGLRPARKHAQPPGPQALIGHYAILVHCCRHDDQRILFTRRELAEQLSAISDYAPYYVERQDGRTRLVRIVVDHNRAAAGIIDKCRTIIREAHQVRYLAEKIRCQQFAIAALTLNTEKVKAIHAECEQAKLSVPVVPDVIPHLFDLINGRGRVNA